MVFDPIDSWGSLVRLLMEGGELEGTKGSVGEGFVERRGETWKQVLRGKVVMNSGRGRRVD